MPGRSLVGDRLIFVVGSRRSGTNWLQRILEAHPGVAGTNGESFLFSRGIAPLLDRFHHSSPSSYQLGSLYADRERVLGAVRDLCDVVFGDLLAVFGPADRLVERTPEHVGCLDVIGAVYPEARVVHIIRDGRDVVRSLMSMDWAPAQTEEAAGEWRRAVVEGREEGRRLAHYREVRYEHLLAEPRTAIAELYDWLGLDVTDAVLDGAVAEAAHPFAVDPKMPGVGSGKWRGALGPADLEVLMRVAGDALTELGYVDGDDPGESPRRTQVGPPPPSPARSSRKPAAALAALRRRFETGGDISPSALRSRLRRNNDLANRVVEDIATGAFSAVAAALADNTHIYLALDPTRVVEGRGGTVRSQLLDALQTDEVFSWKPINNTVLPAVPTTTIVTSYQGPRGQVAHRVLAVSVNDAGDITRLAYHRLG